MTPTPGRLAALLFSCGAFGLLLQAILLRELGVVFLGHELPFNLALASWLLWTGLGSAPGHKTGSANPSRTASLLGLWCLLAPPTVLAVRLAKLLTPLGGLPGVAETFLVPLALLGPVCWTGGAIFRAAVALAPPRRVYLLESAGALAGGLAFTVLIAAGARGLTAVSAAAAALALLSWLTLRGRKAAAFAAASLLLAAASGPLDAASRRLQWRGWHLLGELEGRYGHLAVAALGDLRVVFDNGVVVSHVPDPSASEESVHWALLSNPMPERVLVLGGGAASLLAEVLKHPVRRVDVVTADRAALDFVRGFLDPVAARAWSDPRVAVFEEDPRSRVRESAGAYDVILQLSPEPANASTNRFFTAEFFREARRALAQGGVLAFSIPSAENYLSPQTAWANAGVRNALQTAFAYTALVPGGRLALLASDRPIELEPASLARVYARRRLSNRVLVPQQFPFYLHPERRGALLARLAEFGRVEPDSDLRPAAYFGTWRVWLAKFVSPAHFLGLCVLALGGLWGLRRLWTRRRELAGSPERSAVLSLGFSGMGLELTLLLAFQAASGALYWKLGLLMAAFMAGLACGAWAARGGRKGLILLLLLLLLSAAEAEIAWSLPGLVGVGASRAAWVFGGLLAVDGSILGAAYPLACGDDPVGVYAADLWGSALGAFLTAAFLVPLAGMRAAILLCAAALIPAAGLLAFRPSR